MDTWDPDLINRWAKISDLIGSIKTQQVSNIETATKPEIKRPVPASSETFRSYENMQDPPATVVKFKNSRTGEVESQIPSEVSIKIYKQMLAWLEHNK